MSVIAGAAIGAGISAVSGIAENIGARRSEYRQFMRTQQLMDKTNQFNTDAFGRQKDHNIDMWNRNNQYNSPIEQMARMREAGLNPNLLYGSFDSGNSGTPPTADISSGAEAKGLSKKDSVSVLKGIDFFKDKAILKNMKIKNDTLSIERDMRQIDLNEAKHQDDQLKHDQEWITEPIVNKDAIEGAQITYEKGPRWKFRKDREIKKDKAELHNLLQDGKIKEAEVIIRENMSDIMKVKGGRARDQNYVSGEGWHDVLMEVLHMTGIFDLIKSRTKGAAHATKLYNNLNRDSK